MEADRPKPMKRTRRNLKSNGGRREDSGRVSELRVSFPSLNRTAKIVQDVDNHDRQIFPQMDDAGVTKEQQRRRIEVRLRENRIKKDPSVRPTKARDFQSQFIVKNVVENDSKPIKSKSKSGKVTKGTKASTVECEAREDRNMFLGQIHQGLKLKSTKHLMVDKSAPKFERVFAGSNSDKKIPPRPVKNSETEFKFIAQQPSEPGSSKYNRKFSCTDLESELKMKLRIFDGKSQTKQQEDYRPARSTNLKPQLPQLKSSVQPPPPLPPKPKDCVDLRTGFNKTSRFRSLRNLRKKSHFDSSERLNGGFDGCDGGDERTTNASSAQQNRLETNFDTENILSKSGCKKTRNKKGSSVTNLNHKNQSDLNSTTAEVSVSAANNFKANRQLLSNLFGHANINDCKDAMKNNNTDENNNRRQLSKSSKSVNKLDDSSNEKSHGARSHHYSGAFHAGKREHKHVTNLDDDSDDESYDESEDDSDDVYSILNKSSEASSSSDESSENWPPKNKNALKKTIYKPNVNIKKGTNAQIDNKKLLKPLQSHDPATYSKHQLLSPTSNNDQIGDNKESGVDINSRDKKVRPLQNLFPDINNPQADVRRTSFNVPDSKFNNVNIKNNERNVNNNIKIMTRTMSAGVGKALLKRPTCPPPPPPAMKSPKPPLPFNYAFESRFVFHDILEISSPPSFKSFTVSPTSPLKSSILSPTINPALRFFQKPTKKLSPTQSSRSDPYETTV